MSERPDDPFGNNNKDDQQESDKKGLSPFVLFLVLLGLTAGGIFFLMDKFPSTLMDEDNQIDLVRLLAILLLVMSSAVGLRRISASTLPRYLRDIAIWVCIFAVLLLGYSYRDLFSDTGQRLSSVLLPGEAVVTEQGDLVFTRSRDGHFYIDASVEGIKVRFLVDTGASSLVLSPADAARLGFDFNQLLFNQTFETANGTGRGARTRLDSMTIGSVTFDNIPASINEASMSTSLLGMSFLKRLHSFEFQGDQLILRVEG
ncbi:TIGR02281 family clan AA aspartic protease [Kiloniella laminariae]|uniref:TIGR02281 family clan AA aspartic protease n=1 Tax=Kiloniella laminariae TaxID=454162 RepID=A0ABT4LLW4_9PROT|nr:TIGR02281 family clan AA aspartic protease [Kiloniella laminariae]MCZ4282099.1 TIGR02281 family clan AA aspartic protease [Kiloniella laminariae]